MFWTLVKRGAELSTDHHLVVSWIRWQGKTPRRPGRPKRVVRVCWERLAEEPVKLVFDSHLRQSFDHVPVVVGNMESEWALFRTAIVEAMVLSRKRVDCPLRVEEGSSPSWWKWPGRGLSGFLFWSCCPHDPVPDKRRTTRWGLPGKFKAWLFQHGLLPRLMWLLTIYEVPMTSVESVERHVNKNLRRWSLVNDSFRLI